MSANKRIRSVQVRANDEESYFQLDDGEEIIDMVKHGQSLKVYICTPAEFECGKIKDDGEPCQITVSEPEGRCHHHG